MEAVRPSCVTIARKICVHRRRLQCSYWTSTACFAGQLVTGFSIQLLLRNSHGVNIMQAVWGYSFVRFFPRDDKRKTETRTTRKSKIEKSRPETRLDSTRTEAGSSHRKTHHDPPLQIISQRRQTHTVAQELCDILAIF